MCVFVRRFNGINKLLGVGSSGYLVQQIIELRIAKRIFLASCTVFTQYIDFDFFFSAIASNNFLYGIDEDQVGGEYMHINRVFAFSSVAKSIV
jgi:hypothetical protein